jgi:IstB-like ATP binding protein
MPFHGALGASGCSLFSLSPFHDQLGTECKNAAPAAPDARHGPFSLSPVAKGPQLPAGSRSRQLTRIIARYGRVDLLILNELGYLSLDRREAELLFEVLTEIEERASIAVGSYEPFSSWTKTFTDPRLCAGIVDRLTYKGQIIETGTSSYRVAHARANRNAP